MIASVSSCGRQHPRLLALVAKQVGKIGSCAHHPLASDAPHLHAARRISLSQQPEEARDFGAGG
jgi:hypothetical protein